MPVLRVVTRGSLLARTQTQQVVDQLRAAHRGLEVETIVLTTSGDRDQSRPLPQIGGKGLFTEELERALLDGEADVAVHSMKDLPTDLPAGLSLGAVPARADARDALVLPRGAPRPADDGLSALPASARIGTSSTRRQALLRCQRPDLLLSPLRGNLDTRLRKLDQGQHDAIVLAAAGLLRLGWAERISALLPVEVLTPAPAQGALALECRSDDRRTLGVLALVEDPRARGAVTAERAVLAELGGGCSTPLGAFAEPVGDGLSLLVTLGAADGLRVVQRRAVAPLRMAEDLGRQVARMLAVEGLV